MRPNAAHNAFASGFLALIGVLLVAAGFLAAIIVIDGDEADTAPAVVADRPRGAYAGGRRDRAR